ncbi:hypothetical protein GPALN_012321 [Globodera pallida]|nr:hypothetical protein GPALN_012321 [Globodera pallida]
MPYHDCTHRLDGFDRFTGIRLRGELSAVVNSEVWALNELHIFLDTGSIEVFADGGRWVGTHRLDGFDRFTAIRLRGELSAVVNSEVWALNGNEPPPPGLEPDNDEGFGEQDMDMDEDFVPPPPPPSPPHAVLRPIGYGRPQQRPATPQQLYMPPLPQYQQQQFNVPPPHPQMVAQLFRFQQPQNQLPVGHAHWQHQNPQAQAPQQLYMPPLPQYQQQQFNVPPPHQQMVAQLFRFQQPQNQLPVGHAHWQHQNPQAQAPQQVQPPHLQRFFPPQAAENELFRRLQQWRGPPIDPRRPRNQ